MQLTPLKGKKARPRDVRKSMHQKNPTGRNSAPKGLVEQGSDEYPLRLTRQAHGGLSELGRTQSSFLLI